MYRIAICEDEPSMAQENEDMICRVLESHGFQRDIDFSVAGFSTPGPLLSALQKQPAAFHLLLLDIGLAQENGVELASRLREWNVDCSISVSRWDTRRIRAATLSKQHSASSSVFQ